jgi:hypothetical protein
MARFQSSCSPHNSNPHLGVDRTSDTIHWEYDNNSMKSGGPTSTSQHNS